MRLGINKSKEELLSLKRCSHRVIIPLYIPNEDDYYKDALKIFKYCLFSIRKTAISPLKISVISNGSTNSINDKLLKIYKKGQIDELIIEDECIGKINSILKVLRTVKERLVTITDADVLFDNGWEQAIIDVFKSFPSAGAVCPVPVFRTHLKLTSNIWLKYMFSNKLRFSSVKDSKSMTKYANSIGWPWLDEKYKDVIATLKAKDGNVAVLGCSHFVATYKNEVFEQLPKENSNYKLGGGSEFFFTDEPVLKMGGYRLSTYDNYAYHMGNLIEDWMVTLFKNLKEERKIGRIPNLKLLKKPFINYKFFAKGFSYIISRSWLKKRIFKMKGLNEEQIQNLLK